MRSGARVLFAFVAIALLQSSAILAANVVVNPRSEFGVDLFTPLIPDDPRVKTAFFGGLASPPDILVLGSSRIKKIAPSDLRDVTGLKAFNFGFAAGGAADALAVYRYVTSQGMVPREIVYGLEADQLQASYEPKWQTRVSPNLGPFAEPPATVGEYLLRVGVSFEPRYARDSLRVLAYTLAGYPESESYIDPDGYFHYRIKERERAQGTYDLEGALDVQVAATVGRYRTYTREPDGERVAALQALVREAREKGTTVRIFLTPLHPRAHAEIEAAGLTHLLQGSREVARALCAPGVHVQDFLHVGAFAGDPDEFFDDRHYAEANARAIVQALYNGDGDLCAAPKGT